MARTRTPARGSAPLYVVARGTSDRPLCQHLLPPGVATHTACGVSLEPWSVEYTSTRLAVILCKRSACRKETP